MNFNLLIGQTFQEKELYDLLLKEIEQNYDRYLSTFLQIYFESLGNGEIRLTCLKHFKDMYDMNDFAKANIEKLSWLEICANLNHQNLFLVRRDRTGWGSSIFRDHTRTEETMFGWLDEYPDYPPLTDEEIRIGFMELMGLLKSVPETEDSKDKVSVRKKFVV